jgi:prolyl-tRNA editing enzyme YbaK/EbsC (Cys-tRNA(Pro) deacylase)
MTAAETQHHPRVAEVAQLLHAAGATGQVRVLPDSARTAAAAAAQLGVEVGAIANSLVFEVAGRRPARRASAHPRDA